LIDLSDGLASELNHIAQKSNVSLEIDCDKIPTQPEMLNLSLDINSNCLSDALTTLSDWQLFGGEDYQLLATFDPKILEATGSLPGDFKVIGRVLQKSAAPFGSIEPSESPIVMLLTSDGKCRPLKTEKIFNHFGSPTSR
jgi:thiamine-monophosphate kinase